MPFSVDMKRVVLTLVAMAFLCSAAYSQNTEKILQQSKELLNEFDQDLPLDSIAVKDTIPHLIPLILPAELFIPTDRLAGITPWNSAPIVRPTVHVTRVDGLSGLLAAGAFDQSHPDKFFSTLNGTNIIDIPQLFISEQRFLGNTLRLGKKVYFVNGILYGAQLGIRGNNWGMGTREGVLWRPNDLLTLMFWNQYFQSVQVYTPVIFPIST